MDFVHEKELSQLKVVQSLEKCFASIEAKNQADISLVNKFIEENFEGISGFSTSALDFKEENQLSQLILIKKLHEIKEHYEQSNKDPKNSFNQVLNERESKGAAPQENLDLQRINSFIESFLPSIKPFPSASHYPAFEEDLHDKFQQLGNQIKAKEKVSVSLCNDYLRDNFSPQMAFESD